MKIRIRIIRYKDSRNEIPPEYRVTILPENLIKKVSVKSVLVRFVERYLEKGYQLEDYISIDNYTYIKNS